MVGRFLDAAGYLVRSADHRLQVAASALTSVLDDWCAETGERLGRRHLAEELERRGAERVKGTGGRRFWHCIGKPEDEA
jgi:hypothetical protein